MDELQDIELDSEAQGSMSGGGAPQTVRKTISLNLTKKTKLKAKSSAKSGKSKKERREREGDDSGDAKVSRRSKIAEKKRDTATDDDDREDEELDWSHKVMFVGEKIQNPMIHICEKCSLAILIYGRLSPCKHVFCLSCAEKSNGVCTRCKERIERIEPAGIGQIFVCSFGGSCHGVSECRRSYLSQRDLIAHIKHRHEKEGSTIPESELIGPQGVVRMPFINGTPNMVVQPPISIPNVSQASGLNNPVMISAMPPPAQPIFVDANRMPILPTQPPFQPMPQNMQNIAQTQYQTPAYIPQNQTQYQGIPQAQPAPSLQNTQPQVQRPEDMQVRTSSAIPPVQAPPPPPPPPQSEWRGGTQMPANPPDWNNQGRTGNYQTQQYYK